MRLSDAFVKPLAFTRLFLADPQGKVEDFRLRLETQLSEARLAAMDAGYDRAFSENALFAVIAWIDETVMCSEWEAASDWRRRPLQKSYFNTTRAGVEFFSRLETLRGDEAPVREVYFLCLALGFKGRYGTDGGRFQLDEIKARELKALQAGNVVFDGGQLLFPEAYAETAQAVSTQRWRPSRTTVLLFGVPVLLLTLLYFVFQLVLASQVDAFMRIVQ